VLNLLWEEKFKVISDTFAREESSCKPILLWQDEDGQKVLAHSFLHRIDTIDQIVTFNISNLDNRFKFNIQKELYGKLNERSLLFKAQIVSMSKHLVSVYLPDKVRVAELRRFQRLNLGRNSAVYSNVERVEDELLGKRVYNIRLFDISRSGASFIVKSGDKKFFKKGEILKVLNFGTMDMGIPLEASIVYAKDISYSEGNIQLSISKLGLKFDHSLPERMYNTLLERIIK
jgi:hypothetical protein